MLFNSMEFLFFFPVVCMIYFSLPEKAKVLWLLVSSYFFYMCWNVQYVLLILFSTMLTYVSGLMIAGIKTKKYKKIVLFVSIVLNLLVLFWFKYSGLAINIISEAFSLIHIKLHIPNFDILLPVGISFYTFQTIGYIMDVYRKEIGAEKNFFLYALFVSFFPQLVAGPIERSKNLFSQLAVGHKFSFESARDGFLLMLWGYFLKIVLADRIAIFVDMVYADYVTYSGWYLIVATVLFGFQIYCDFYGYSVIAMGAAEILGIHLMENFDAPYLSVSVAEFWRKWHISLTTWFKDYLYYPLGGNRKGKIQKYINQMIVFLISGLWHGAKISYIAWGALNGAYQVAGKVFRPIRDKIVAFLKLNRESYCHKLLCASITFLLFDFSLVFFRANRFREAFEIIRQMAAANNLWILFDGSLYECGLDGKNFRFMLINLCVLIIADFCKHKGIKIRNVIAAQDCWFRCLFIAFAICYILTFGIWGPEYNEASFIYFQF